MVALIFPALTLSEYSLIIEKPSFYGPEVEGFSVLVSKQSGEKRQTLLESDLNPFQPNKCVKTNIAIEEIVFPMQAEIEETASTDSELTSDSHSKSLSVSTEISRGFRLNIPELGSFLISHEGNVIFGDMKKDIDSLKISTFGQVILNGARAKKLEIEAQSAFLSGKGRASVDFLSFKGARDEFSMEGLYVVKGSKLRVSDLVLENAELINAGTLSIAEKLDLNGGNFFNVGETDVSSGVLWNIACLLNGSRGNIRSSKKIALGADRFTNLGRFQAADLNVASQIFGNQGEIATSCVNAYFAYSLQSARKNV